MKVGSVGDQDIHVSVGGAQATILVCVLSATGIVYVARLGSTPSDILNKPGQMLRIAIGGTVVLIVLLVTSMASPEFAKAMGWLLLLGTVIGYGSTLGITAARLISAALGHSPVVTTNVSSANLLTHGEGAAGLFTLPETLANVASTVTRSAAARSSTVVTPPRTAPKSAWQILTERR